MESLVKEPAVLFWARGIFMLIGGAMAVILVVNHLIKKHTKLRTVLIEYERLYKVRCFFGIGEGLALDFIFR